MSKQQRNFIVALAGLAGGALLFLAFRNGTRFLVPSRPPDETNRVHHTEGFSLVCPDNWVSQYLRGYRPAIVVSPRTRIDELFQSSISVEEIDDFYPFEDSSFVTFQDAPATLSIARRSGTFTDPAYYSYRLQFDRRGRKFLLRFQMSWESDVVPEEILPYLESFRVSTGRSEAPQNRQDN